MNFFQVNRAVISSLAIGLTLLLAACASHTPAQHQDAAFFEVTSTPRVPASVGEQRQLSPDGLLKVLNKYDPRSFDPLHPQKPEYIFSYALNYQGSLSVSAVDGASKTCGVTIEGNGSVSADSTLYSYSSPNAENLAYSKCSNEGQIANQVWVSGGSARLQLTIARYSCQKSAETGAFAEKSDLIYQPECSVKAEIESLH